MTRPRLKRPDPSRRRWGLGGLATDESRQAVGAALLRAARSISSAPIGLRVGWKRIGEPHATWLGWVKWREAR